ncbi:MAG: SDR family NAD(P)-dependent oxidoreductase [Epsilonproteobacteria bacterium]|nr:SDR family NAD(P)-dependent oxidoreductase [Campylobacterota bacterium]
MTLKDKVIIVTGGTGGIGLAIVEEALKFGAKVMIHSSIDSQKKAKELAIKFGKNCAFICADLSKLEQLKEITDACIKRFGRIDSLVNNAGVFPRNNILNIDKNTYEYIMNVNFRAPLFLCQNTIKYFKNNNVKGSIVNIGSINAYCGQDDLLVYSASKGALMTMTRNLADFCGKYSIRINQLNVGWTHTKKEHETQLKEGNPSDWYKNINKIFAPRGKILTPKEIANHVIFWISDYSIPVSGSIYEIEQYPIIGRNKINA